MDFEKIISENPHLIDSLISKKVDPHFFNDPLALHVSFDPINKGGMINHTYSLISLNSGDLKFVASNFEVYFLKIIFGLSFLSTIYFSLLVFRPDLFNQDLPETIDTFSWIKIFLSATFMLACLNEHFTLKNKTRISQKLRRVFLKGKKPLSFESIHAIQLLLESLEDRSEIRSGFYISYEINIVLKNKERIHLMDQAGYLASRADAERIAKAIKVPLWDTVKARVKTKEVIIK